MGYVYHMSMCIASIVRVLLSFDTGAFVVPNKPLRDEELSQFKVSLEQLEAMTGVIFHSKIDRSKASVIFKVSWLHGCAFCVVHVVLATCVCQCSLDSLMDRVVPLDEHAEVCSARHSGFSRSFSLCFVAREQLLFLWERT